MSSDEGPRAEVSGRMSEVIPEVGNRKPEAEGGGPEGRGRRSEVSTEESSDERPASKAVSEVELEDWLLATDIGLLISAFCSSTIGMLIKTRCGCSVRTGFHPAPIQQMSGVWPSTERGAFDSFVQFAMKTVILCASRDCSDVRGLRSEVGGEDDPDVKGPRSDVNSGDSLDVGNLMSEVIPDISGRMSEVIPEVSGRRSEVGSEGRFLAAEF